MSDNEERHLATGSETLFGRVVSILEQARQSVARAVNSNMVLAYWLMRQIQSSYYQRILANRGPEGLSAPERDRLPGEPTSAGQVLKSP